LLYTARKSEAADASGKMANLNRETEA